MNKNFNEYSCEFKSEAEIIHYDDASTDIINKIRLSEFGTHQDRSGVYQCDCAVMKFDNGIFKVSYYSNLSDFSSHSRWDPKHCFVVCFEEYYKQNKK